MFEGFTVDVRPDYEGFIKTLTGQKPPQRVYFAELFLDAEIKDAICPRFGLEDGLDKSAPDFPFRREIAIQRFLGYDNVRTGPASGLAFPRVTDLHAADTAREDQSMGERNWVNEAKGPVTTWQEFEKYPWPKPGTFDSSPLEWFEKNLPDDMSMTASCHSFFEQLMWLTGIETLSFLLYDQPDLVTAVTDRVGEIYVAAARVFMQFDKMKFLFGGDDMGHKTATLVSPDDLRRLILPWHKKITQVAHDAGRYNILHSCGNLEAIMDDIIDDVGVDAKHSFEDVIEPFEETFKRWGSRVGLIGGIDVDFIARSSEEQIRRRVRDILDTCHPGRFALGTGNSVANYIPVDNYLVMLDEGRRYSA